MAAHEDKRTLYLVGLGLCSERDLPLGSLETLSACGTVFVENYTNFIEPGALERLERLISKPIVRLGREEVEGEKRILEQATHHDVALLVPGDPMVATTHVSLLQAAQKAGLGTRVLHASSIFGAAAGESGLQIYKFGKTATITYWRRNFEPTSFLDVLEQNRRIGAHTLCLLDVDVQMGPMTPGKGLEMIRLAQRKRGVSVLADDARLVALSHVGWPDQRRWSGTVAEFEEQKMDMPGPAVLIVAGNLHFLEEEALDPEPSSP